MSYFDLYDFAVISKIEYSGNLRPAVYMFFSAGECLYVGYASQGFKRLYTCDLKHANRKEAIDMSDEVKYTFLKTRNEAIDLEEKLIHELHPRFNRICSICNKNNLPIKEKVEEPMLRFRRPYVGPEENKVYTPNIKWGGACMPSRQRKPFSVLFDESMKKDKIDS